ncbi:GtrA family protein [Vibrio sp.]|uniref:GtrA family protein n=1 Tax=Vibrio sp. TaxID=678 RepID=UPI00311DF739
MSSKIVNFAVVGGVGFLADCALFSALYYGLEFEILTARIASFLFAATITWLGNRTFTFVNVTGANAVIQWLKFMTSATASLLPNLATLKLIMLFYTNESTSVMVAFIGGVLSGMVSNFLLSQYWVFGKEEAIRTR